MQNLRTAMNRGAFDFATRPVDLNHLEIANFGPAVLGGVGSAQTLSFTVIGDTVNTASRLQG
jgi:class 3 adenylate cyclase